MSHGSRIAQFFVSVFPLWLSAVIGLATAYILHFSVIAPPFNDWGRRVEGKPVYPRGLAYLFRNGWSHILDYWTPLMITSMIFAGGYLVARSFQKENGSTRSRSQLAFQDLVICFVFVFIVHTIESLLYLKIFFSPKARDIFKVAAVVEGVLISLIGAIILFGLIKLFTYIFARLHEVKIA